MRARAFLFSLTCAALFACGEGPGSPDDAGADAAEMVDASCAPGEIGCACDDGACAGGACLDGRCVDCRIGTEDCTCRSDGTCSAGLRCEGDRCEACPEGQDGCACGAGCDEGLVCELDVCVRDTCEDGTVGCPCDAGACGAGAFCDGTLCQACTADVEGCPCEDGACTGGLVCDADLCRAAVTCDDLFAAGTCGEHQRCEETPGSDATCVPESCVEGFRWSTLRGRCVACVSEGCLAEPTCVPDVPTSLDCGEHRLCVESDGGGECGGCEPGYVDEDGVCVDARTCGGVICGEMEYCDTTRPTPTCTAWPCGDRSTVVGSDGACSVRCERSCAVAGATGAYWPYASSDDSCICETVPGYYFDAGGESAPVECDADGDGWVRDEVRDILDAASPDAALVANARCAIRAARGVMLVDEHGIASLIESCEEGLLQDRTSGDCTVLPLRLFETKRNDVEGEAARLGEAPPYASGGRRFRAAELNSLTKACVNALGDYDDDNTEDVRQVQPRVADTTVLNERGRLRSFAHFVELYRTSWAPPTDGSPHGHLVITERSRCSAFPLGYGEDTAYDAADGASYWRSCTRRRHPDFDADVTAAGFDFAQWSCSSRQGSCPAAAMPPHASEASFPDPGVALLRDIGACELGGAPAADGVWRGMGHHSQFQCVQVVADGATTVAPHQRRRARFGASGDLVFNACAVTDCAGAPGCTDSAPPASGLDPHDPRISCTHEPGVVPAESAVGWAALTYRPYGHVGPSGTPDGLEYAGGCVSEDAEWPDLCPFPEFGRCASADSSAFGRYHCYGWESLFLWADDDTALRRSELAWAPEAGASTNMSVYNPASAPACM